MGFITKFIHLVLPDPPARSPGREYGIKGVPVPIGNKIRIGPYETR